MAAPGGEPVSLGAARDRRVSFPEPIQRLMGYRLGAFALGYVDDVRDPIEILRASTRRRARSPCDERGRAGTVTTRLMTTITIEPVRDDLSLRRTRRRRHP